MASNSEAMDVTPSNEQKKSETSAVSNPTQSQIAQKTWEISNSIQGQNNNITITLTPNANPNPNPNP